MKLTFLGTRGEIEARTRQHRMHSSLLVSYRGAKVMIGVGENYCLPAQRRKIAACRRVHAAFGAGTGGVNAAAK